MHRNVQGKVVAVNVKHLHYRWEYLDDKTQDAHSSLEGGHEPNFRDCIENRPLQVYISMSTNRTTFGYCLAHLNSYESKSDFLKDFG